MKKILITLVLVCLSACSAKESNYNIDKKELDIVIASDIHYLAETLNDDGSFITQLMANADGKDLIHINEITDLWIAETLLLEPDAVIITGDLTFNGELLSHQELASKLKQFKEAQIEVYVLPGNHDIDNYAVGFEGDGYYETKETSEKQFIELYDTMGYNQAHSKDIDSLSYSAYLNKDYLALFLDGQDDTLSEVTITWIKSQQDYASEKGLALLVFGHYNLFPHSLMFSSGFSLAQSEQVIEVLSQPQIVSFSGHMHPQSIAIKEQTVDIATGSLAVYPFQYGILHLEEDATIQYQTEQLLLSEQQDQEYKAYFDSVSRNAFISAVANIDQSQQEKMLNYVVQFNQKVFSGTLTCEEKEDATYQAWLDEKGFFSSYLSAMMASCEVDKRNFQVNLLD